MGERKGVVGQSDKLITRCALQRIHLILENGVFLVDCTLNLKFKRILVYQQYDRPLVKACLYIRPNMFYMDKVGDDGSLLRAVLCSIGVRCCIEEAWLVVSQCVSRQVAAIVAVGSGHFRY